jgi:hypothetical protein
MRYFLAAGLPRWRAWGDSRREADKEMQMAQGIRQGRGWGMSRRAARALSVVLVLGIAPAAVGCSAIGMGGGSNAPAEPRKWGKAPEVTVAMKVTYVGKEGGQFSDDVVSTLTSAFADAGYKLVADSNEAQVMMHVKIRATEKPSFMQTTVNGQRQITWGVNVDATYTSLADSSMIDKTTAAFESDNGAVDAAAQYQIEELIAQATKNGKLQKHAEALFKQAEEAAQAKKDAEEKLWQAANVEDCSKATTKKSCDGVKEYLRKYKDGVHAAEARKALDEHELSKVAANDEEAWAAANHEKCANPDTSKDCKGVEHYL